MSYEIKRPDKDIDDQLNRAAAWEETGGSAVPGMTYEQGVQAGIRWAIGDTEEIPVEKEPEE